MSVLTVLQLDGGARGSVQLVSCGCPQTRWCSFFGSEVENWSATVVEKKVSTLVVGMCLCVCVNCQFGARCVCVCWRGDLSSWVWHLGGQSDAKPT